MNLHHIESTGEAYDLFLGEYMHDWWSLGFEKSGEKIVAKYQQAEVTIDNVGNMTLRQGDHSILLRDINLESMSDMICLLS